jgi:hypothetical protein
MPSLHAADGTELAGHYPWLDDPGWFVSAVTAFLD